MKLNYNNKANGCEINVGNTSPGYFLSRWNHWAVCLFWLFVHLYTDIVDNNGFQFCVIAIFLSRNSFKTYLKRSFMYILWNTDTGNSLLKLIPIFTFISRCALPDFNTLNKLHQPIRTNMVRSSEEQRASEPSVKIFFPLNWKHVLSSSEESCTAIVWMRSHSTKTLSNDCFI